ncbi:carbon-monoxide dehydrogenase large subunit, partial [Mycobacterium tuberculosis]|uniref:molybdopterin cofactor-binding domain-containing protein n=1 Tax=Mycobacterium tuberculosis TaxID=1773 RepID=UPI000E378869
SGASFCVVALAPGPAVVPVRRFLAVAACGPRLPPLLLAGPVPGGLVAGLGLALLALLAFAEAGPCLGGSLLDSLL